MRADARFSQKAMGGTRRKSFDIESEGTAWKRMWQKFWVGLSHCQNSVPRIQDLAGHGNGFDVLKL